MRTVDIVVAGFFSPAAVAAVGLANIYGRLPLWIGIGLGDSAIALSSQDTTSNSSSNRNEAVSQAIVLSILIGIPFVVFGIYANVSAIEIIGADSETVRLAAGYLAIIMISAPAFHLTIVCARAIQGTGDTQSPMYINTVANVLNIVLTIVFAFGVGPFPRLSVLGIGLATAIGDAVAATAFLIFIRSRFTELNIIFPRNLIITKQLIIIGVPRTLEGFTEVAAEFPFNAMLLIFGTEVNAAYHIGRRVYQQVAEPLARGYGVGANVIVGQAVGRHDPDDAYFSGLATGALAFFSVGTIGIVLFIVADQFVILFTRDPVTIGYATDFARVFAITAFPIALYKTMGGALRGGSETRPPLIAKISGVAIFMIGVTYVIGIQFEYGVLGAYIAIVGDFIWRNVIVGGVYLRKNWLARGETMMKSRGSSPANK